MWQPNPENSIDWGSYQYPVGCEIPETTGYCDITEMGADPSGEADCTLIINDALKRCPAGGHVYIPSGRYRIDGSISYGDPLYGSVKDRVLKGAGIGETILVDNSSEVSLIYMGTDLSWTTPNKVPIGPVRKGDNTILTEDASVFVVGQMVYIDEENDDDEYGSPVSGMPNNQTERLHRQVVGITAIEGDRISIAPAAAWNFTHEPQLNDFGYLNGSGDYTVKRCGLEDMTLDRSKGHCQISVGLQGALGCWIRNVESHHAPSYHFHAQDCLFCSFTGLVAREIQGVPGPNQGGFLGYRRFCSCLLTDSIFDRCFPGIEISSGSCANVFGYNYIKRNTGSDGQMQGAAIDSCHGSHTGMNLYEGNIASNVEADGYYGSASRDTIFRNQCHGDNEEGILEGSKCISLCRWSQKMTVANCILGTEGMTTLYEAEANGYSYETAVCWRLGYPNMGNNSWDSGQEIPPLQPVSHPQARDRRVEETLTRIGNYDYVSNQVDEEADKFPPSLYWQEKPSFFGALPWPAIGAELTPFVGVIPATARYELGLTYPYGENPQPPADDWTTTPDGKKAHWLEADNRWIWGG